MSVPSPELMAIFGKALEIADSAERGGFLDAACQGNAGLRAEVDALLRALEPAGSFLEGPTAAAHCLGGTLTSSATARGAGGLDGPGLEPRQALAGPGRTTTEPGIQPETV